MAVASQAPVPYTLLNSSCIIPTKIPCIGLDLRGRLCFQSWPHRPSYYMGTSTMLSCSMPTKLEREFSSWIWTEVSENSQQQSVESGELSAGF